MKTLLKVTAGLCLIILPALSQNAAISPVPKLQFFDNNGVPLSGGLVFTYQAGGTNPIATFTDATASSMNTNPVVLDASGRASIWLLPGTAYKFIVDTSSAVPLYTTDDIVVALPSSGPWTVTGPNISNNNAGRVGIGCSSPTAELSICGSSSGTNFVVSIQDASNAPGILFYGLGPTLFGSINADSTAALRIRAANAQPQLVVQQSNVLIEDQTPSTGSTLLTLKNGAGQSGDIFSVQSNSGTQLAFIDQNGEFAAPLFNSTGNGSGFTFQNANSTFLVDYSGDITFSCPTGISTSCGSLYGTGGNLIVDQNQNGTFNNLTVKGTCTGCGGGGGGGSIVGTANQITVTTSGSTSTISLPSTVETGEFDGLNAGTSLVFNSSGFEVNGNGIVNETNPSGAVIAAGYVDTGLWYGYAPQASAPTAPGSGYSAIAYCTNTTSGCSDGLTYWVYSPASSAWSKIDLGAAGGSGITTLNSQTGPSITVAGTTHEVIVTNSTNLLTLSTPQAIDTTSNVIFANVTTGVGGSFNSQAGTSGTYGFLLSNNKFLVDGVGDVSMTGQLNVIGTFSTGACASPYAICVNNLAFVDNNLNTNVNNLTITGTCTGCATGSVGSITGTANQVIANHPTGAVTLSLPQSIATTSAVNFGTVTAGAITSTVSAGGSTAFQAGNLTCPGTSECFVVDGQGNANFYGRLFTTGGLQMGSWGGTATTVIDSSRDGFFANLTVSGTCTGCGGGGGGVTSIAGTANQIYGNNGGGTGLGPFCCAVTLSLPQSIATTSNVTFGTLDTAGAIQSQASGGSTAFDVANGSGTPFIVDGYGDVSSGGSINAVGNSSLGLAPYRVNGTAVIDSSRDLVNISTATVTTLNASSAIQINGTTIINSTGTITTPSGQSITSGGLFLGAGPLILTSGGIALPSGELIAIGGVNGVTCSGTPTSAFASVGGIVTHC